MPIVTFTSDYGLTDHYVAVVKGASFKPESSTEYRRY